MLISIDLTEPRELAGCLHQLAETGIRHAVLRLLNDLAWKGRSEWRAEMARAFTLRNRWTQGSIRVELAQLGTLSQMQSVLGSVAPYMQLQEKGGTKHGTGQHGVRIAMPAAAGQTGARTKPVRAANRMASISLYHDPFRRRGKASRIAGAVAGARAAGKKFVFIQDGNEKGIYRMASMVRGAKLTKIWDMSRGSVTLHPIDTLWRATKATMRHQPSLWEKRIKEQLMRAGFDQLR